MVSSQQLSWFSRTLIQQLYSTRENSYSFVIAGKNCHIFLKEAKSWRPIVTRGLFIKRIRLHESRDARVTCVSTVHTRAQFFENYKNFDICICKNFQIFFDHYEDNDMEYKWHTIYKKGEIIKISL